MKKLSALGLIVLFAWGLLAGCERRAAQLVSTPGPLPTPRVSTETVVTATMAPTATYANTPVPTSPPTSAPTLAPPTATPAPIDPADLAAMALIEKGKPRRVETGKLMPFYRAQRDLNSFQTDTWTYIIDIKTHKIVEILPVHETAVSQGGDLSPAELEQKARDFINKAAPGTVLDGLRSNFSSQTSNYLFRWEDHRARVMEDGFTYPYIQVALSSSGQLLNYFNTLVFIE